MGFSQASLTKQLTSSAGNEFTAPQAESAVANSGADWNAEAVKAAKGYMSSGMGFSRQSLIAQLTSAAGNQFTDTQAGYAADQVGLK
ncbi:endonuclease [Arthrobacter sp. Hiyo1]|uniref:Ltp family lipoprotein n=1 Tax=Arthrobacter sp. Hiyo1 TaxID=1588020 RepID=UPI0007234520|nr:Ltp family lipoprotein [Arthrobacter sp. Hiyo1]GAP57365.1 endonuclease [Arthrobacter sp. Hiyo1]